MTVLVVARHGACPARRHVAVEHIVAREAAPVVAAPEAAAAEAAPEAAAPEATLAIAGGGTITLFGGVITPPSNVV